MRERLELPRLATCRACSYAACICPVLKGHTPECTYRRTVLAVIPPAACDRHEVVACTTCSPCDCKKGAPG